MGEREKDKANYTSGFLASGRQSFISRESKRAEFRAKLEIWFELVES